MSTAEVLATFGGVDTVIATGGAMWLLSRVVTRAQALQPGQQPRMPSPGNAAVPPNGEVPLQDGGVHQLAALIGEAGGPATGAEPIAAYLLRNGVWLDGRPA